MKFSVFYGVILTITALILCLIICPFWFFVTNIYYLFTLKLRKLGKYYWKLAIVLDQGGGVIAANFFNWFFIKKGAYQLGNPDESISSWLGKNKMDGNLLFLGKVLDFILDKIDPGHSIDAIEEDEDSKGYR